MPPAGGYTGAFLLPIFPAIDLFLGNTGKSVVGPPADKAPVSSACELVVRPLWTLYRVRRIRRMRQILTLLSQG